MNTDGEKIRFTFVLFSKSARKDFFSIIIFRPIRIRKKVKFNYSNFSHSNRETNEHRWCKNSIYLCSILEIREKKFLFYYNFSTNQNSRKNQIQLFEFFSLESRDQWTLMLKKFYWPFLYCRNPRDNFFFIKIFRPIRIREKIKCNYSAFSPLESTDQSTLMLKNPVYLSCILEIREKKFFFY